MTVVGGGDAGAGVALSLLGVLLISCSAKRAPLAGRPGAALEIGTPQRYDACSTVCSAACTSA